MPVVGWLGPHVSRRSRAPIVNAFRQGLAETGFIEDRNVRVEYRFAENHGTDRLPALADDLVHHDVNVIVASAIRATLAAKAATTKIQLFFATANNPVQFGLVASLDRPGGNLTGTTWLDASLGEKRLELLHKMLLRPKPSG